MKERTLRVRVGFTSCVSDVSCCSSFSSTNDVQWSHSTALVSSGGRIQVLWKSIFTSGELFLRCFSIQLSRKQLADTSRLQIRLSIHLWWLLILRGVESLERFRRFRCSSSSAVTERLTPFGLLFFFFFATDLFPVLASTSELVELQSAGAAVPRGGWQKRICSGVLQ